MQTKILTPLCPTPEPWMLRNSKYKPDELAFSYHALARCGGRWVCEAEFKSNAFSCTARAERHFQEHGIDPENYRIVMGDMWITIQTRQHLKDVGLN